jgi:hypothetical protein
MALGIDTMGASRLASEADREEHQRIYRIEVDCRSVSDLNTAEIVHPVYRRAL